MSVNFAGIELENRLVAASSPLTESANRLRRCSEAGFGAAILKSAADYARTGNAYGRKVVYCDDGYYADSSFEREIFTLREGLALYRECSQPNADMPLIPSVSAGSLDPGEWLRICREFSQAGALLLQLDFFYLGTLQHDASFYDKLRAILRVLTRELPCPVMPKLNPRLDPLKTCALLGECGIRHVSLLDSMREAAPSEYGLHEDTTSYFGGRQLPLTRQYLSAAKSCGLAVCAGGGITSKADAELLLSEGADLVQIASYVLNRDFTAVHDFLDDCGTEPKSLTDFLRYNPWCDAQATGHCEKCGACPKYRAP